MNVQHPPPVKPRIRAPAIWHKRKCPCRQRMFVCFGLPLLPPSATLLGVAYGMKMDFGVFHVLGFLLTSLSALCLLLAILIALYRKFGSSTDSKKVSSVEEGDVDNDRRGDIRTLRSASSSNHFDSSRDGVNLVRMTKIPPGSMLTDNEAKSKHRSKKSEKRKPRKPRTKLPPVKEEDGRARFEKSMEERDKAAKRLHKRTKSESRRGFEEYLSGMKEKPKLTKNHLNMFNILHNQGSQDSLQMKRSMSMSDIGDSASERQSVDTLETPRLNGRAEWEPSGTVTARPVLIHTSSARTGVRTSRFASVL